MALRSCAENCKICYGVVPWWFDRLTYKAWIFSFLWSLCVHFSRKNQKSMDLATQGGHISLCTDRHRNVNISDCAGNSKKSRVVSRRNEVRDSSGWPQNANQMHAQKKLWRCCQPHWLFCRKIKTNWTQNKKLCYGTEWTSTRHRRA